MWKAVALVDRRASCNVGACSSSSEVAIPCAFPSSIWFRVSRWSSYTSLISATNINEKQNPIANLEPIKVSSLRFQVDSSLRSMHEVDQYSSAHLMSTCEASTEMRVGFCWKLVALSARVTAPNQKLLFL
mgnify:FL=1